MNRWLDDTDAPFFSSEAPGEGGSDYLQLLGRAVSHLPELQRVIFLARRVDQLPYGEISRLTGLTERAIERQMSRAIESLSKKMEGFTFREALASPAVNDRAPATIRSGISALKRLTIMSADHLRRENSRQSNRAAKSDMSQRLTPSAQEQLRFIVQLVFSEFEAALSSATQRWKKAGRILAIFAPGLGGGRAKSKAFHVHLNLIVVVNDDRLTSHRHYWSKVQDRLDREQLIMRTIDYRITILPISLTTLNRELRSGTSFFLEVVEAGLAIYKNDAVSFETPRQLSAEMARAREEDNFAFWHPLLLNARRLARFSRAHGQYRDAAFLFHQAVERAYHCLLSVLTLYSPKTHRIDLLRDLSERTAPALKGVWVPQGALRAGLFERLRTAYVAARYSPAYSITDEELELFDIEIGKLHDLVRVEIAAHRLPDELRDVLRRRRAGAEYEQIAAELGLESREVERRVLAALDLVSATMDEMPRE